MNIIFCLAILVVGIGMIIGEIRGSFKILISLGIFLLSGLIVMFISPAVNRFLTQNTTLDEWVAGKVMHVIEYSVGGIPGEEKDGKITLSQDYVLPAEINLGDGTKLPAGTKLLAGTVLSGVIQDAAGNELSAIKFIENLPIPRIIKKTLVANNKAEVYIRLGVSNYIDYVSTFIIRFCMNIITAFLVFLLLVIIFKVALALMDLASRLPGLATIDHVTGALLGGLEAILLIEFFFLLLIPFSGSSLGMAILRQINTSEILTFLFHRNPLLVIVRYIAGRGI